VQWMLVGKIINRRSGVALAMHHGHSALPSG